MKAGWKSDELVTHETHKDTSDKCKAGQAGGKRRHLQCMCARRGFDLVYNEGILLNFPVGKDLNGHVIGSTPSGQVISKLHPTGDVTPGSPEWLTLMRQKKPNTGEDLEKV